MKDSCPSTTFFHGKIQLTFTIPFYQFRDRNTAKQMFCKKSNIFPSKLVTNVKL